MKRHSAGQRGVVVYLFHLSFCLPVLPAEGWFCGRCVLFGVLKIHERLTFENILGYIFFRPKSNHEVRDLDVVL